jgi:hypothetical protein
MTDAIIDKLVKTIKCYEQGKSKYLIYFTTQSNDLVINVTNGIDCWQSNKINENYLSTLDQETKTANGKKSYKHFKLLDALNLIDESLNLDTFELKESDDHKLLDLKLASSDNRLTFSLDILSESSTKLEIKKFVFNLYENKFSKQDDCNKHRYSVLDSPHMSTSSSSSSDLGMLKRFNISRNKTNTHAERKQGYSIINPLNKKRKVPKGVEFESDEDDE